MSTTTIGGHHRAPDQDPDGRAAHGTPAHGNWGRWGADDEIGALNLMSDAKRLRDLHTPTSGRIYSLGLPAGRDHLPLVPYRGPVQRLTIAGHTDQEIFWDRLGTGHGSPSAATGALEDVLITPTHAGTHIDALCHVFHDGTTYNGFPVESETTMNGATRAGIEKIGGGGIAGRAVMLDVAAHLGVPHVEPGFRITSALLEETRASQGTPIRPGDILLLHTGWTQFFLDTEATGQALRHGQGGLDLSALEFIDEHQVAVVGADNSSIEVMPFDGGFLSVHLELLWKRGIHQLEHLDVLTGHVDRGSANDARYSLHGRAAG